MDAAHQKICSLVAADDLEEAAKLLGALAAGDADRTAEVVALRGNLTRAAKAQRRGLVDDDDAERSRRNAAHQILAILNELGEGAHRMPAIVGDDDDAATAASENAADIDRPAASVFLSYNHGDADEAVRLKDALESAGVSVRIDRADMRAGERIDAFIERSIRATDATVCVISNRSLQSAWVAMETVQAFHALGGGDRQFIAGYVDDDFFQPRFRLDATDAIDARIAEIEALLPEYAEKRLGTDDIDAEKSRLYALRNALGEILAHLRGSLLLDLRGDAFDASAARIVSTLAR